MSPSIFKVKNLLAQRVWHTAYHKHVYVVVCVRHFMTGVANCVLFFAHMHLRNEWTNRINTQLRGRGMQYNLLMEDL